MLLSDAGRMADVVLSKVSKPYDGGVEAIRGLDLRVDDGEMMVLVGPSGSGKTTVLRLIAGLEDLSSGEIRIGGRLADRLRPRDRDVAMVFQDYALYSHMTVERNIAFALGLRRVARDEVRARVAKVAGMLGIEDLLQRRPHALSGGAAAAGGAGPGDRPRAGGVPVRRAALEPRRAAAGLDPLRDQGPATASRHDRALRHARPGGGAEPR
ncbi:MAG: ATP-binding cassette domain-containing protein [Planctomycetota bacterium]